MHFLYGMTCFFVNFLAIIVVHCSRPGSDRGALGDSNDVRGESRQVTTVVGGASSRPRTFNGGQKLIVATVLDEPYIMIKQNGLFLTGNDRFEGYVADILQRLSTSIGFEYEIRLSSDGRYGEASLQDGQWDGILGEVLRNEADLAAGPVAVTEARQRDFDFTEPILSLRSSALLRRSRGGRRVKDHLVTADQLIFSNYSYGVQRNSLSQRLLSNSSHQLHRAMWAKLTTFWPSAIVDSLQEGVERVRREHFAFILDSPTAEYLACRRPCDLYATEPFLDVFTYAFATRKDETRLRQVISQHLRDMRRTSDMQALYLKWWKDDCINMRTGAATSRPIDRASPPVSGYYKNETSRRIRHPFLFHVVIVFYVAYGLGQLLFTSFFTNRCSRQTLKILTEYR